MDKIEVQHKIQATLKNYYTSFSESFIKLKNDVGINVWFYNCFRLFYLIRNKELNTSLYTKKDKKHSIISTLNTFFYILKNKGFEKSKLNSDVVVVSYQNHITEEKNKVFNRYLFGLIDEYPVVSTKVFDLTWNKENYKFKKEFVNAEYVFFLGLRLKNVYKLLRFIFKYNRSIKNLPLENEFRAVTLGLKGNILSSLLYYYKYLSYDVFFSKNKSIRGLVIMDENSSQPRAIIDAAKKNKIKTFAIQHGAIHEMHPAYNFDNYPIDIATEFTDVTFLWGEYYRNLLVKLNYPCKKLHVIGNLRQQFFRNISIESPSLILNRDKFKKIIVFALQPQPDKKQFIKELEDVIVPFKKNKELLLILRPHPSQSIETLEKYLDDNIIVDNTSTLEEHFFVSDALITSYSTVGMEYSLHFKPLFILDYYNQDIQGYIKNGIGIKISSRETFELKLNSFLNGEIEINKNSYNLFIEKYFYKGDDKVIDRLKGFINGELNS